TGQEKRRQDQDSGGEGIKQHRDESRPFQERQPAPMMAVDQERHLFINQKVRESDQHGANGKGNAQALEQRLEGHLGSRRTCPQHCTGSPRLGVTQGNATASTSLKCRCMAKLPGKRGKEWHASPAPCLCAWLSR